MKLRYQFLVKASDILPLFGGIMLFMFPRQPPEQAAYFALYFKLLLLFCLWLVLRSAAPKYVTLRKSSPAGSAARRLLRWTPCLLLAAGLGAVILTLETVKLHFAPELVYLALAAMGTDGLSEALFARRLRAQGLALKFAAHTLLGYASFQIAGFSWSWQPLVFSLGLALMLLALRLAGLYQQGEIPLYSKPERRSGKEKAARPPGDAARALFFRLYAAALFLGPSCIVALGLARQLERNYLLIYAVLPPAAGLINRLLEAGRSGSVPGDFVRHNLELLALFVLLLIGAGLWYG